MHPVARLAGAVAIALGLGAGSAHAATFTVNSIADADDGTCGSVVGGCTLHEAMDAAVATPGHDTIAFDPAVFQPGTPNLIQVIETPILADPAGTALDASGAGVIIQPANPIVFASAPGKPLTNVTVVNLTVRSSTGSGIIVCGGEFPSCDQDVSSTVVRNVVSRGNAEAGVKIAGRNVTKTRIVDSTMTNNDGHGIDIASSASLTSTRIERCTTHSNVIGVRLRATGDIAGTSIVDSIAARNDGGFSLLAGGRVLKTKMVNVTAVASNEFFGIGVEGVDVASTTITRAVASSNEETGIVVEAHDVSGTTFKDVVANGNGGHGIDFSTANVAGTTIAHAKASGNRFDGIRVFAEGGVGAGGKITRAMLTENGGTGLLLTGSGNVVKSVRADGNRFGIRLVGPGSGNTITKCTAHGSGDEDAVDGIGIAVANGNTNNVIQKNSAFFNDGNDLADGNANCDGNVWKRNAFLSHSAFCIR